MFKRTEKSELVLGDWTEPYFEYLQNNPWRVTEKVDGTNIRIEITPVQESGSGEPNPMVRVRFDGRTDNALLPSKLVNWLMEKFFSQRMKDILAEKFPDGGILYGEGFGAGIGKSGGKYQPHQSFILFDVRVGEWWLQWPNVCDVAAVLELPNVPVVGFYTLGEIVSLVSNGINSHFGDFQAEGVVAVPEVDLFARNGDRIITKLKTRDFEKVVNKE
jgi:hypothetical protein